MMKQIVWGHNGISSFHISRLWNVILCKKKLKKKRKKKRKMKAGGAIFEDLPWITVPDEKREDYIHSNRGCSSFSFFSFFVIISKAFVFVFVFIFVCCFCQNNLIVFNQCKIFPKRKFRVLNDFFFFNKMRGKTSFAHSLLLWIMQKLIIGNLYCFLFVVSLP